MNNTYSMLAMYQEDVPLNLGHILIHLIPQQPLEENTVVFMVQLKKKNLMHKKFK